ncbi:ATP-binding protein [Leptolyngbya sp. DQ-M1]|uniref:ATP-binding protein n=1 Tax=Leptolyngbya sp. DQ-M1 TaxID=2933920 RepID=UPI003297B06D
MNQSELALLLPLLQRLDRLLEQAASDEKQQSPLILTAEISPDSRLASVQQKFSLSQFDLDVIAIALAPELDRRYESLYAYLQNDVRSKRPSVDLALNLLCVDAIERLEKRDRFASTSPLIQEGLLSLESEQSKPTLLAQEIHLNPQLIRFLLHQPGLDPGCELCELVQSTISLEELPNDLSTPLKALIDQDWQMPVYFQGSDRALKRKAAQALAKALNCPLLIAAQATDIAYWVREAWFQNALLYVEIDSETVPALRKTRMLLSGEQPFRSAEPLGIVTLMFPMPDFTQRQQAWKKHLEEANLAIAASDLDALADRFRLTDTQIVDAIATARHVAEWKSEPINLFAAARAQSGQDMTGLARKINPVYGWDDIILSTDSKAQLEELCNQAKYRPKVYQDWDFGKRLSRGKGLNVLFSGLPGTGKTMAAEVIAQELQLDLYQIDLSQIVSKYIGETEKNLDRIFTAAANSNAILLFDEADALFGKRSEVQDSHDRYANIEIGYLLQKMEEYEGIAILTTNLRSSLDDAFVRRLRFMIDFPLPNERDRLCIWERIFPAATPRSPDVDLSAMARRFEISGANIRNIALAAAFLAASEGGVITMTHLIRATQREYQKMGKLLMDDWH